MAHLLAEQSSSRVPRRYVFLDTEAHRATRAGLERQTWRCGVTAEIHYQPAEQQWSRAVVVEHGTPEALWQTVADAARPKARTVVVAHNLAYDLQLADGLRILDAMGWSIDHLTLSHGHVGLDAVHDGLRLVLVDSLTTLPSSIEQLGKAYGIDKPKLPAEDAPAETWYARCRTDVEILMRAYLAVVTALRDRDLGCWARSGSGIGWNTFVRRHLLDKVLVHERPEVREVEQLAAYGGRAEAWRHGTLSGSRWTEWDFESAYAHVMADEWLPAYLYDEVTAVKMSSVRRTYGPWRWLIEARVETDVPVLPVTDHRGTFYPVGTMTGWWWDNELMAAEDEGAEVTVIRAYRYKGARWLATWANWVLDLVWDQSSPEAVILGMAAKHWQRALVGRTAMRYRSWTEVGEAYSTGIGYMPLWDRDSDTLGACLELSGRRFEAWERTWSDQALPQVLSSVIAHCRVNLWRAMRVAGLEHVVYTDTDALITDTTGSRALQAAVDAGELGSLRRKAQMTKVTIHGPRYVVGSQYERIAGVPHGRVRTAEHTYEATRTEHLAEAIAAGRPDEVVVRPLTVHMSTEDWHRRHLPDGSTEPYLVCEGIRVDEERQAG